MTENIVALASHPRKVVETKLDKMVAAINREFERAQLLDNKACHARVAAGQMLIELRAKIEAGEAGRGVDWWQWYDSKFERSRRDAEKCMALAIGSMDPEAGIAAIEDERRRNREAQAKHRERVKQRQQATVSVPPSYVSRTHTDNEGDVCPDLTLNEFEGGVSEVARWMSVHGGSAPTRRVQTAIIMPQHVSAE